MVNGSGAREAVLYLIGVVVRGPLLPGRLWVRRPSTIGIHERMYNHNCAI